MQSSARVQSCSDVFQAPLLLPACSSPHLPGQGYGGEEGRLLSAPSEHRHRGSPTVEGHGWQPLLHASAGWLAVPMAAQPVWTVQAVKNPTAHVA